ncbi:unnamed protein product, partial [Polarella glacialis]
LQRSRVQRQASPPPVPRREDPASRPFFTGRWPGGRNDYGGEAGIRFVAAVSSEVTALGRLAEPPLMEGSVVTLWQTDTQEPLATAEVGPKSRVEGNYAWEPLTDELVLHAGKEYRLTQRCRANMPDRWCDARATAEEVAVGSWASLASFVGGVARNSAGFPNREDGDLRRAGMVNFKAMLRPSPGPAMQLVSREQLAHSLARATAADEQRRGGGPQEVEGRLAALACLLELFVDELANLDLPASAMALLAPEEELRELAMEAQMSSQGCSIFDSTGLARQLARQARRCGHRDAGLLLVDACSGEVLGLCPRPRAVGSGACLAPGLASVSFDERGTGRPLAAWELAERLQHGLALARGVGGQVDAFLPDEVNRQCIGLRVKEAEGGHSEHETGLRTPGPRGARDRASAAGLEIHEAPFSARTHSICI